MTDIYKGAIVRQVINGVSLNNQLFLVIDDISDIGTYEVDLLEENVTTSDVDVYLRRDDVVLIRTGSIGKLSSNSLEFVGDGSDIL